MEKCSRPAGTFLEDAGKCPCPFRKESIILYPRCGLIVDNTDRMISPSVLTRPLKGRLSSNIKMEGSAW